MGCVFCASGVAGLKRHLGADEIVAQVLVGRARLDAGRAASATSCYMGMGEPLHNYDATVRVAPPPHAPATGIGLSSRRVTVSTSGLVPEIARLGEDFGGQIGLAISLHAADDETRSRLMPINKKYPLAELMDGAARLPAPAPPAHHHRVHPRRRQERRAGRGEEAREAPPRPAGEGQPHPDEPDRRRARSARPTWRGVLAFQQVLCDAGYSCFIRRRRGDDVSAACGQLALLGAKPKVRVNRAD